METILTGFDSDYAMEEPTLEEVSASAGDVILEFGAPWCGYCQSVQPALEEVLAEHPDLTHIKVYDGKGKPLGRAFRVKLWPTLILLHDGKEVARLVRPLRADEIRRLVTPSE